MSPSRNRLAVRPVVAAARLDPATRSWLSRTLDDAFFWYGTAAAVFLALVVLQEAFARGWSSSWLVVVGYIVIAYLILPRLHTALSRVYLPDYFIGRTRTREGILGDPVNLAVTGSEQQIHAVMRAAGWILADDLGFRNNLRIVLSTLRRRSYPSAPVSNLYLFGHPHRFCYQQEVDGSPGKRHHVRFWPAPEGWLLPGGHGVDWLAAGTYDRSVGLSVFTWQVTHRIADSVDEERDHIVAGMRRADDLVSAEVIENFSTGYHSRNGGGDAIVTDGDLPVVDVRQVRVTAETAVVWRVVDDTARPFDISAGVVLMVLRSLAELGAIAALLTGTSGFFGPSLASETAGQDPETVRLVIVVASVSLAVVAVFYGVLALVVHRGSNAARVLAMVLSCVSVGSLATTYFVAGAGPLLQNNLPGLALDICVLLALSGSEARDWARGAGRSQRERRLGLE